MTWDEAKTRVKQMLAEVEEYVITQHKAGLPDDDGWELDAEALRLLLSHAIPREDRERALRLWAGAEVAIVENERDCDVGAITLTELIFRARQAETRRLLKLEVKP